MEERAPPGQADHKGAKCEFVQMKVKPFSPRTQSLSHILTSQNQMSSHNEVYKDKTAVSIMRPQQNLQGEGSNGEGCTKGGMSCERKCSYSTGETSCSTILTVRLLLKS